MQRKEERQRKEKEKGREGGKRKGEEEAGRRVGEDGRSRVKSKVRRRAEGKREHDNNHCTAHRFWLSWRSLVGCRSFACLKRAMKKGGEGS